MEGSLAVDLRGERCLLLAERALFWPRAGCLLIADLHLGKGDAFRRHGISIPRGGTSHDLQRLSRLLAQTQARELCVLGDFVHGPIHAASWQAEWLAWRARHRGIVVTVVGGNHDRRLPAHAAALGVAVVKDARTLPPFRLTHVPEPHDDHVIAGHLHPRVRMPGLRGRWPAFWLQPGVTVLPAFSAFTGGVEPVPNPGDTLVLCMDGMLALAQAGERSPAVP